MTTNNFHQAIFLRRSPKEVLCIDKDKTYHVYDLQIAVKSFSVYLSMTDLKRIAIYTDDAYLFLVAFSACIYAKKEVILLGSMHVDLSDKNEYFDALISDRDFKDSIIPNFNIKELIKDIPLRSLDEIPAVNHDAVITKKPVPDSKISFFTSGSTGKSKKIEKTLSQLEKDILHLEDLTKNLDDHKDLIFMASVSPCHLYGLTFRVLLPLLRSFVFDTRFFKYHEELCDNGIGKKIVFVSSPAILKKIDKSLKSPEIIFTLSAGASLSTQSAKDYYQWALCPVTEIYGSTETNFIGHRESKGEDIMYTPFKGVSFTKKDDVLYLNSPLLNEPFKLDDNIVFENDKFIVKSRKDKVVKLSENRVSLTLIEQCSCKFESIEDAVAMPIEKNCRTHVGIVLATSLADKLNCDDKARHDFVKRYKESLKENIIAIAIPRYIRFVKQIPVNSMGKKVVNELRGLFK